MNIKKVFITSYIIGLLIPLFAHAQIKISEIMYDPEGSDSKREWIEVINNGTESIDLNTYFLFENNVYHKLVAQSSSILEVGQYAIIADSITDVLNDYSGFSGIILDSVFSLNNTGESISIANSQKEEVDTFTYSAEMGADGNGQSLQINDSSVITAGSTFGLVNKTESEIIEDVEKEDSNTSASSSSNSKDSSHSEQVSVSSYTPSSLFKVDAGRKRTVSIHTPIQFEGFISKSDMRVRYHWNFGDFSIDTGKTTKNTYKYPGIYQVVLEAKNKDYTGVARTEVVVIEPQLSIKVSTSTVVFTNMDTRELNIGEFRIIFDNETVIIPQDTIIKSKSTIVLQKDIDQRLMSFEYPDKSIYQEFVSN